MKDVKKILNLTLIKAIDFQSVAFMGDSCLERIEKIRNGKYFILYKEGKIK